MNMLMSWRFFNQSGPEFLLLTMDRSLGALRHRQSAETRSFRIARSKTTAAEQARTSGCSVALDVEIP